MHGTHPTILEALKLEMRCFSACHVGSCGHVICSIPAPSQIFQLIIQFAPTVGGGHQPPKNYWFRLPPGMYAELLDIN
jgi:hypothetical protein